MDLFFIKATAKYKRTHLLHILKALLSGSIVLLSQIELRDSSAYSHSVVGIYECSDWGFDGWCSDSAEAKLARSGTFPPGSRNNLMKRIIAGSPLKPSATVAFTLSTLSLPYCYFCRFGIIFFNSSNDTGPSLTSLGGSTVRSTIVVFTPTSLRGPSNTRSTAPPNFLIPSIGSVIGFWPDMFAEVAAIGKSAILLSFKATSSMHIKFTVFNPEVTNSGIIGFSSASSLFFNIMLTFPGQ